MEHKMKTLTPTKDFSFPTELTSKAKRKKKILKYLLYGALALAALLSLSHLIWNWSGSNQWELAIDKNGVKVWTLKTPGSNLVRVKATTRVKSRLAGMAKLLEDLDSCVDAYCFDAKEIQRIKTLPGRSATYVRFKFDIPGLKTRQYVLFAEHYQDPDSKKLEINIIAAPDMIPRDECCVRVTHLHNNWKITPLKNGELDIEFTQDTDLGGAHYLLANFALTQGMYKILHDMQDLMNKERYRNAQVDQIQELAAQ
jgi:hypothetical protein